MWQSILLFLLAFPFSALAGAIAWIAWNFKTGAWVALSVFALFAALSAARLLTLKTFSTVDLFLPIAAAAVWSLVLTPLELGSNLFSAPAAIGSALLLTLSLWRVRHQEMRGKGWLIYPVLVFIYEMLPVNIPGPVDDYLAFGSSAVTTVLHRFATRNLPSP